jgi:type II secretory pathway pseudopilin PulG
MKRKSDLANIAKALDNYRTNTGQYPVSSGSEKISSTGNLYKSLVSDYITQLPIDPLDPTYYYGYESDNTNYTLSAILEDTSDSDGRKVGSKNIYFLKSQ